MTVRQKAIVYGAGDYGFRLVSESEMIPYELLYFVDKNYVNKKKIGTYEVKCVDSLKNGEFDVVIIAVYSWKEVLSILKNTFYIDDSKIRVYDIHSDERILAIKEKEIWDSKLNVERINIITSVQNEILYEAWKSGEFDGIERIYVFGSEEDYKVLTTFFDAVDPNLYTCCVEDLELELKSKEKVVFVGDDYMKKYKELKKRGKLTTTNWCVIPLFDVKDAINV